MEIVVLERLALVAALTGFFLLLAVGFASRWRDDAVIGGTLIVGLALEAVAVTAAGRLVMLEAMGTQGWLALVLSTLMLIWCFGAYLLFLRSRGRVLRRVNDRLAEMEQPADGDDIAYDESSAGDCAPKLRLGRTRDDMGFQRGNPPNPPPANGATWRTFLVWGYSAVPSDDKLALSAAVGGGVYAGAVFHAQETDAHVTVDIVCLEEADSKCFTDASEHGTMHTRHGQVWVRIINSITYPDDQVRVKTIMDGGVQRRPAHLRQTSQMGTFLWRCQIRQDF